MFHLGDYRHVPLLLWLTSLWSTKHRPPKSSHIIRASQLGFPAMSDGKTNSRNELDAGQGKVMSRPPLSEAKDTRFWRGVLWEAEDHVRWVRAGQGRPHGRQARTSCSTHIVCVRQPNPTVHKHKLNQYCSCPHQTGTIECVASRVGVHLSSSWPHLSLRICAMAFNHQYTRCCLPSPHADPPCKHTLLAPHIALPRLTPLFSPPPPANYLGLFWENNYFLYTFQWFLMKFHAFSYFELESVHLISITLSKASC